MVYFKCFFDWLFDTNCISNVNFNTDNLSFVFIPLVSGDDAAHSVGFSWIEFFTDDDLNIAPSGLVLYGSFFLRPDADGGGVGFGDAWSPRNGLGKAGR